MARITVEDCEQIIENRFELVILAAERTRQLAAGEKITIEGKKDDKRSVTALREIAEQNVSPDKLKEKVIDKFRSFVAGDEMEEDLDELMETDTYSPYIGMEVQALENTNASEEISIVDAVEQENHD